MDRDRSTGTVGFTIKRVYLYTSLCVVLALLVGFGSGVGAATVFLRLPAPTPNPGQSPIAQATAAPTPYQTIPVAVATEGRPYWGPEDPQVTLVEFTDYQCPFCAQHFELTYAMLRAKYEDKLRYVIRNFPVSSIHPRAQKAAEAAECAYAQGKFWDYHDTLFERQTALDVDNLKGYAADLGLDASTFGTCLDSGQYARVVLQDLQDGLSYGVRGTPTFFINGQILQGAQPVAVFESLIDAALAGSGSDRE